MSVNLNYLGFLLERYSNDTISQAEFNELCELAGDADGVPLLIEELKNAPIGLVDKAKMDSVLARVLEKTDRKERQGSAKDATKVVAMYRRKAFRWVAAAGVILVMGYVLWVTSRKSEVGGQKSEVATTHDVSAPKETRAVLTLADGRKVYLDSVDNGTIAQESDVNVIKAKNGAISYHPTQADNGQHPQEADNSPVYNTLFNPRGSRVIDMQLSDGSRVWLNAGSSVTYPVTFTGKTREVEITGEAYFEVAHIARGFNPGKNDPQNTQGFSPMPFIVRKGDVSVTVLGTHFNVNAYDDEESLKVTLLEGSVRVRSEVGGRKSEVGGQKSEVIIKPGEQAISMSNGQMAISKNVDLEEVMAWKNGTFFMKKADIASIMRQVSRWYDVDVVYQNGVPKGTISGEVPRSLNLSEVLKVYELSGVKFKIEGRKVTVMQ